MERRSHLLFLSVIFAAACALGAAPRTTEESHIMSRPGSYPNWATNVNYAGGPDIGTATKVVPSAGRMADGWRNNDVPPPQEQNYEMDLINQWVQWLDTGSVVSTAALAALVNLPDGTRVKVGGSQGYYTLSYTGLPATPDGYWVITATVGGQPNAIWIHHDWDVAATHKLALIGPLSDEVPWPAGAPATAPGRINQSLVPFGFFFGGSIGGAQFSTASTTTLTNAAGAVLNTWTVTTLANGDYVYFRMNGVAFSTSAAGYEVGVYASEDNGATWKLATPENPAGGVGAGVPYIFDSTGVGSAASVDLSFVWPVINPGIFKIQLRAASIAAGTTKVQIGASRYDVHRT